MKLVKILNIIPKIIVKRLKIIPKTEINPRSILLKKILRWGVEVSIGVNLSLKALINLVFT
jgi:hypothetical protein